MVTSLRVPDETEDEKEELKYSLPLSLLYDFIFFLTVSLLTSLPDLSFAIFVYLRSKHLDIAVHQHSSISKMLSNEGAESIFRLFLQVVMPIVLSKQFPRRRQNPQVLLFS